MSTATPFPPEQPLRAVFGPADADSVRRSLQGDKQRWAAFLTARDALIHRGSRAGQAVADLIERCHLGPALRLAARTCGWLLGALGVVRRGIRVLGVKPALLWLLTTSIGQRVVAAVTRGVVHVARLLDRAAAKAITRTLGLFGAPGQRLAGRLQAASASMRAGLTRRLTALGVIGGTLLDPAGLPMQSVGSLAKARALSALLRRFLPRPWNVMARVLANVALVPASVRREAIGWLRAWTARPSVPVAPEATLTPDPTPPASPTVQAAPVLDLDAERARHEQLPAHPVAEPGHQSYPAPGRTSNAKRRR